MGPWSYGPKPCHVSRSTFPPLDHFKRKFVLKPLVFHVCGAADSPCFLSMDIPIASCDKSHTNSSTFLLSWACMILYLQDCLPMPGFSHKAYLCVCFACLIPRGFVLSLGAGVNCCQRVEKSHAQKSRNTISSHSWKQPGVLGLCFPAAFPIMSRMLG